MEERGRKAWALGAPQRLGTLWKDIHDVEQQLDQLQNRSPTERQCPSIGQFPDGQQTAWEATSETSFALQTPHISPKDSINEHTQEAASSSFGLREYPNPSLPNPSAGQPELQFAGFGKGMPSAKLVSGGHKVSAAEATKLLKETNELQNRLLKKFKKDSTKNRQICDWFQELVSIIEID